MYTYDENIFSDLYKEVHGFRPRDHYFWKANDEQKQEIWDSLLAEHERVLSDEMIRQNQAVLDFERQVNLCISHGAKDRTEAVAWVIDSLKSTAVDLMYGAERVCYEFGLPYSMDNDPDIVAYFNSDKVKEIINSYDAEMSKEEK